MKLFIIFGLSYCLLVVNACWWDCGPGKPCPKGSTCGDDNCCFPPPLGNIFAPKDENECWWECGDGKPPCPQGSTCGEDNCCTPPTEEKSELSNFCNSHKPCEKGWICVDNDCQRSNKLPIPDQPCYSNADCYWNGLYQQCINGHCQSF